jgi:DNA primase large subunit
MDEKLEYRRNDNISHFICRLAYCRNEELRRWFLTQEARLFNLRLQEIENPAACKNLLEEKCNIVYEYVNQEDWEKYREEICFKIKIEADKRAENFLKVPFKEAVPLIGRRQVFLKSGYAFV